MRILQLCYEFPPVGGGGSRVVDGLSRELSRQGHEVHVVTMAFRGHPRSGVSDGVRVHRVPSLRRSKHRCTIPEVGLYLLSAPPALRHLVASHEFDIVHGHFILPDGILAEGLHRRAGLPYILTAHGSDVPGYNPHRLRLAHRLTRSAWNRAARSAEAIVCPSVELRELVLRRDAGLSARLTVIPYGFELDRYRPDQPRQNRILVVSRLLRRKGVEYLLEAVKDLPLEAEIHIVGDGPELSRLRRISGANGGPAVVFHGWLDNRSPRLTELYETSDIFVLTSERENFPVALMEAMDAGLAIITSQGTGCAEVVGDAGVLVPARDPVALRRAVVELVSDPERRRRLGRAARLRLERHLSWSAVADRYVELYERNR